MTNWRNYADPIARVPSQMLDGACTDTRCNCPEFGGNGKPCPSIANHAASPIGSRSASKWAVPVVFTSARMELFVIRTRFQPFMDEYAEHLATMSCTNIGMYVANLRRLILSG